MKASEVNFLHQFLYLFLLLLVLNAFSQAKRVSPIEFLGEGHQMRWVGVPCSPLMKNPYDIIYIFPKVVNLICTLSLFDGLCGVAM